MWNGLKEKLWKSRGLDRDVAVSKLATTVISVAYYVVLILIPFFIWESYYNKPRIWQEQSLVVMGVIALGAILFLLPQIVISVFPKSGHINMLKRAMGSLIVSLFYVGTFIVWKNHPLTDPLENDVTYIPLWVGWVHNALAVSLVYYFVKNNEKAT